MLGRLPFPPTPVALADQVRRRVRGRQVRRRAVAAVGGAALLVAAISLRPQDGRQNVAARDLQPVVEAAPTLDDLEIEALLSLPPVDLLVVMDRRQDMFIRELEQEAPIQ